MRARLWQKGSSSACEAGQPQGGGRQSKSTGTTRVNSQHPCSAMQAFLHAS